MTDFRGSSPTSDIFSDEVDSLSIRDKSLLKRSSSKHHNNNFKAGYVPVHEQHLNKTGLRGRKTIAFWTLVGLLLILAIGNLLITITILGVLRLGHGMESIELVPEEYAIKFFGDTDLGNLYKRDGIIEGFRDDPVDINSDSAIVVNLTEKNGRPMKKMWLNKNGIFLKGLESFQVKDRQGNTIFATANPTFKALKMAHNLKTKIVESNRIVSHVRHNLRFGDYDKGRVHLKGAEGTTMDGREIAWKAREDLYLTNMNGSIIIEGPGTFLDVSRIPFSDQNSINSRNHFKICVCMPQGKLFRISGSKEVHCRHITPQYNPCM